MHNRFLAILGIGVALLTASSIPANANAITTATATATCAGFSATFSGKNLSASSQFEVDYKVTFTPSTGSPIVKTGSVMIPAHTSGNFSVSTNVTQPLTSGVKYALTGSATLRNDTVHKDENTIPIQFTNANQEVNCAQQGGLSCRGSALRVNELVGNIYEPLVANPPDDPCETDSKSLLSALAPLPVVGTISADTLSANTKEEVDPIDAPPVTAEGKAERANIQLSLLTGPPLLTMTTGVLDANARVDSAVGGGCKLSSNSSVASVVVNSISIPVGTTHQDLPIPLVGTLHFNETIGGPHPTVLATANLKKVTQRALWLQITNLALQQATGVKEVILGEAIVDSRVPCSSR